MSIVETENKKGQKWSRSKTPVEVVSDKLIMFLEGLPTSNSSKQIDHPKYTSLKKGTVVLDQILQNYFNDSLLHVICENCSSHGSESIKSTFTMSRHIKEPPIVWRFSSKEEVMIAQILWLQKNSSSCYTFWIYVQKTIK